MAPPKNAVQFSSFFKYALSSITNLPLSVAVLYGRLDLEKVAKLPLALILNGTRSRDKSTAMEWDFYRR
jgi:hypothetical protein